MWYLCIVFVLVSVCYFLLQVDKKKGCKTLANAPCRRTLPLLGNLTDLFTIVSARGNIHATTRFFQYLHGMSVLFRQEGMFVFWVGPQPWLILCSPETIEPVLNSNRGQDINTLSKYFKPWVGNGLILSKGEPWQKQRRLLNASFHVRILDNFVPIINEQARILVEVIQEKRATGDFVDIFDLCCNCTLDIICETTMGTKTASQGSDSEAAKMFKEVMNAVYERINRPWFHADALFRLSSYGKRFHSAVDYVHDFCDKIIAERVRNRNTGKHSEGTSDQHLESAVPRKRLALLDLLLESDLTLQEIRDQVNTFVFTGHETAGSAVSWLMFLLGHHPDVQERLAEEVDEVFAGDKDRHTTEDDMRQLKYMDMVIKETLRMYPPVPTMPKKLPEDTEINGYLIPKGTECIVSFYSVQHHPDHFPNPNVFDPERFTPENSAGRHHCAFVPFSLGQRNCIGQRFAMMEMKIIASHILRRFRVVSLDPRDKILLLPTGVLQAHGITRVRFLPRN